MLISIRYDFALLAMPKCASTALQSALEERCDIVLGGTPQLKHMPYKVYEQYIIPLIAEQFRRPVLCQPLSLFREPLRWLFSWYSYRTRSKLAGTDEAETRKTYTGELSFEQFLHEHFRSRPANFAKVGRQSQFIESMNGRYDSVRLYRYENLPELIAEIEDRMGRRMKLATQNASPQVGFELSPAHIAEAQRALALEYEIYDRIPSGAGRSAFPRESFSTG